jgi:hypothetical protein
VLSRSLAVACSLVTLLGARAAAAGVTLVLHTDDGTRATWYAEGSRVRVQNEDTAGRQLGYLIDLTGTDLAIIDDDGQAYFDLGKLLKQKRIQAAQREMRKAAPATPPTAPVVYVLTRERRTIHGFTCDVYDGFRGGRVVEEICAVPWGAPQVGERKDYAFLDTAEEVMKARMLGERVPARAAAPGRWTQTPGLAVWRQGINADRSRGKVHEVERLSREPVPAAILSVPAGYAQLEAPPDLDLDRPSLRLRKPNQPAALAQPVPLTPPAPLPPGAWRLTGIMLVMVLFIATLAFMSHAGLVHLAAMLVIDQPTYIEAVFAILIVWAVGVPLQLFEAWLPVAVPLELLATFGAIRISYRTSNGRALALMVVSFLLTLLIAVGFVLLFGSFKR